MDESLLPIGSVVLLKESTKRVMIIGVLQKQVIEDGEKIWDYSGVYYPEGFMGPNRTFLFNDDQIERVFALGYQDGEQFAFSAKISEAREKIKNSESQKQTK